MGAVPCSILIIVENFLNCFHGNQNLSDLSMHAMQRTAQQNQIFGFASLSTLPNRCKLPTIIVITHLECFICYVLK